MTAYNKTPFSYAYHGGGYKLVLQYMMANLHEYIIFMTCLSYTQLMWLLTNFIDYFYWESNENKIVTTN